VPLFLKAYSRHHISTRSGGNQVHQTPCSSLKTWPQWRPEFFAAKVKNECVLPPALQCRIASAENWLHQLPFANFLLLSREKADHLQNELSSATLDNFQKNQMAHKAQIGPILIISFFHICCKQFFSVFFRIQNLNSAPFSGHRCTRR